MLKPLACLLFLAVSHPAIAQDGTAEEKVLKEIPEVEACVPKAVDDLAPPTVVSFHKGLVTAVTAATERAQTHTVQGLNHLHGGWEFEASRHFAVAMREDPRCLMAHWGMLLCMLAPNPETDACRIAVLERMLQLVTDGEGTELERGYAYGIVKYMDGGPRERLRRSGRWRTNSPERYRRRFSRPCSVEPDTMTRERRHRTRRSRRSG